MTTTIQNDGRASYSKIPDNMDGAIKSAVDTVKEQSNHFMDEARNLAETGKRAAQEKIKEVENAVKSQSDVVIDYIKTQPVKSVLIALGTGYALSFFSRK